MSSPSVVIIGAGAAGLSAARWLQANGCSPLVLEGRNRLGGRGHTDVRSLGVPIDFGCAWLHCADINPWTKYARDNGFHVIERDPQWRRRIGSRVTSEEQQALWTAAWARNEALIAEVAASGRDAPVSEVVPNDEFRPLWDGIMTWLMGTDSEFVSSVDFDRYEDTPHNWPIREGFGALIAHAARGLDVRLSTVVSNVDWSGANVRVESSAGVVDCDAVIVTAPTTVLANDGVRFTPRLPLIYGEAFAGVPLGADNKLFFQFAPGTLPFEGTANFIGTDKTSRTASYAVRPSGSDVMLAFFGGRLARELEERNELEAFAREELKSIFGADLVGHIQRSASSAWSTDPYARGSYTTALPGKAELRKVLSEPVAQKVFFAGEANSIAHFGTAHGAWESAVETAARVLAAIRR